MMRITLLALLRPLATVTLMALLFSSTALQGGVTNRPAGAAAAWTPNPSTARVTPRITPRVSIPGCLIPRESCNLDT